MNWKFWDKGPSAAELTREADEREKRMLAEIRAHIAEYGLILSADPNLPTPEYWLKPEGSYWYTCDKHHVHLKKNPSFLPSGS